MTTLNIQNLSIHYGSKIVINHLSFTATSGSCWVIGGESGSGKTTLGKAIANYKTHTENIQVQFTSGSPFPAKVLFVENWYRFTNLEGDRNFYYQQRYNHQQKKETLTVEKEIEFFGKENGLNKNALDTLVTSFHYKKILDEQLFEISSGEHKKLQLIKALWLSPQILIIDQPYTALDANSRNTLNQLFLQYTKNGGLLILLSNDVELPQENRQFATLKNGKITLSNNEPDTKIRAPKALPTFLKTPPHYTSKNIVSMNNVSIKYDNKYVLTEINWKVNAGERWLLQGHNGSGKSTLLSLITGDHPQAYANDIKLFGVQRGGGESIWDIKRRIGLISPEFHWYFDAGATVLESIASGFFDSNGLYRQLRYAQKQQLNELLTFWELDDVKNELLSTLPLGKQRLALLARTIIKNPQLLVLDEPCQGLDQQQTQYFNAIIDEISKNGVTLIYVGHFETQLPSCLNKKLVLEKGKIATIG